MTVVIVAGTIAGWIVHDCWAGFSGKQPMISNVIYDSSKKYPIIAFVFGVLMGHFFWPV